MSGITFKPELSIGHVLQIVALIIGLTAGYYQLKADIAASETAAKLADTTMSAQISANEVRIDNLTLRIEDKLRFIADQIGEIKADRKG